MTSVVAAGSGFLRPAVAMRRSRVKGRSAGDDAGSPLQDLTSPSLTPWEVLGIDVATSQEVSIADVRRAYRARMKVYHPDVYTGDATDKQANARRVVAAHRVALNAVKAHAERFAALAEETAEMLSRS